MLEIFGIALRPEVSTGNLVTWTLVVGTVLIWWIRGWPERKRAATEAKAIELTDAAAIRGEYTALNKLARSDIHDLRNAVTSLKAEQHDCAKQLREAHAENHRLQIEATAAARVNKEEISTMMFVIRLLISELKRLDPESVIVRQAEETLTHMNGRIDPFHKSGALAAAQSTVLAAENAVEEVKHAEGGK